jgi:hypothetical protein
VTQRTCGPQRAVNVGQASKRIMRKLTFKQRRGKLVWLVKRATHATGHSAGVVAAARRYREIDATREVLGSGRQRRSKPEIREDRTGLPRMTDGPVRPAKPGNAGGGKGPEFKINARRGEGTGDWINDPRTSK